MNPSSPAQPNIALDNATILIVDDEEMTVRLLKRMLQRAGYTQVHTSTDPREVPDRFREIRPDLVLLDLHMPDSSGFEVLEQLRAGLAVGSHLPVLMLTGDISTETKHRAFLLGVNDFLTKPLDLFEVRYRISNLLQTRFRCLELECQNRMLAEVANARARELEEARFEALQYMLAVKNPSAVSERQYLAGKVAAFLARALALPEEEIEPLRRAVHLYVAARAAAADLPDRWPEQPAQEFERIRRRILDEADLAGGEEPSALLALAEQIVHHRHEHWDGTGQPQGLSGEQIPLVARIAAVADHFAELACDPLYRDIWPVEALSAEIVGRSERQFDPRVVSAFLDLQARGELMPLWKGPATGERPSDADV